MTLRPLTPDDLDALRVLDTVTNAHPWDAVQWQDSLAQHFCLGLEENDRLTGFAIAMLLPDEAELLLIAIAPNRQGNGCGQALLQAVINELRQRNLQRLLLEVRESNQRARNFYTAAGFSMIGRRKAYYPCATGREDALLYCATLETAA